MATIKFDGIKEYSDMIMQLGKRSIGVMKFAAYDAAGIVCDAVKAATPVSQNGYPPGGLKNSVKLAKFKDKHGYVYTKVIFDGYDERGVAFAIMANVLTTGRSGQPGRKKNPWIRQATNSVREAAIASMQSNLDKKMQEIMKG